MASCGWRDLAALGQLTGCSGRGPAVRSLQANRGPTAMTSSGWPKAIPLPSLHGSLILMLMHTQARATLCATPTRVNRYSRDFSGSYLTRLSRAAPLVSPLSLIEQKTFPSICLNIRQGRHVLPPVERRSARPGTAAAPA